MKISNGLWCVEFCLLIIIIFPAIETQYLAFRRPTTHAGTYNRNEALYGARNAVDGDTTTYSHTETVHDSMPAWWRVNLEFDYVIQSVTIVAPNVGTEYRYLESFVITVDLIKEDGNTSEICVKYTNTTGLRASAEIDLKCTRDLLGNHITITRNGLPQPRSLVMAEVRVSGLNYLENRARLAPTNQIYTYSNYQSSYAVDDDPTTCALATKETEDLAWWQVDLQNIYRIIYITVLVQSEAMMNEYFQDVAITVDNSNITDSQHICAIYSNGSSISAGVELRLECNNNLEGRFVTIKRRGGGKQNRSLGLCDVKVYGEYIVNTSPATSSSTASPTSTTPTTSTSLSSSSSTSKTTSNPAVTTTTTTGANSLSTPTTTVNSLSSPTSSQTDEGPTRLSGGAIAGIVIGSVVEAVILAALIVLGINYYRKRQNPAHPPKTETSEDSCKSVIISTTAAASSTTTKPASTVTIDGGKVASYESLSAYNSRNSLHDYDEIKDEKS